MRAEDRLRPSSLPDSLRRQVRYDFVQATSRKGTQSLGKVEITGPSKVSIKDQRVLIVEGIVGSGLTLSEVIPHLEKEEPLDIKVCALFENPTERAYEVPVDFCGIVVPPKFIIGYGLDFNHDYRGLPYIGVLNEEKDEAMKEPNDTGSIWSPKTLFSEEQIQQRVEELAQKIAHDYEDRPLVMIGVLNGAVPFMMDLIRALPKRKLERFRYDFVSVVPNGNRASYAEMMLFKDITLFIQGEEVLIVDDMADSGQTLGYLTEIWKPRKPETLRTCALLYRPLGEFSVDYYGFEIGDHLDAGNGVITGYGIDDDHDDRDLPYIQVTPT